MKKKTPSKTLLSIRRRSSTRPACLETLETRQLMSAYGFSSIWALEDSGLPANGSSVVRDSTGNLYGTTTDGGLNGTGTVYEVAKGSTRITNLASFPASGATGGANLIIDSAGNLYGTSGPSIFEVVKGSGKITVLTTAFSYEQMGDLTLDSHGNLYGTVAAQGGAINVFELAKGSHAISYLGLIADEEEDTVASSLVIDSSGDLFGTTRPSAATSGSSTVFEVVKGSGVVTTLVTYNGQADISAPIIDSSGNLYGTLNPGYFATDAAKSTVFEVVKGSGKFTTLATFSDNVDTSALVRDASGDLFGTVQFQDNGSSTPNIVFEVAHGSGKVTTVATFAASVRASELTLDSTGNLYGTTSEGSNTLFEVASGSGKVTTLATFGGLYDPTALAVDSAGNVYGVASQENGESDIVFEVAAGTGKSSTLATVNVGGLGLDFPGMVVDSSGNLFGTLNNTLFEVAKGSGKLTTLVTFDSNDQVSSPIIDAKGNLYGTLNSYGSGANSTVFEVAKGSTKAKTLATFSATAEAPTSLVIDSAGNLYGATTSGVFEIAAGSGKTKTLAAFPDDGTGIPSALSLDASGNLYGTLFQPPDFYGAAGASTVFEVVKGSGKITTLVTFDQDEIETNGVVVDSSGNLIGEAVDLSNSDGGFIYEIAKGTGKAPTLRDFAGTTGINPASPLIAGPGGTIFCSTQIGGSLGGGVIMKLTPG